MAEQSCGAGPGPIGACPRPSELGRGCARASSRTAHATVHPHRYGASAPLRST